MSLAEKLSLLILFGLLCINFATLLTMRGDAKLEKRAWIGLDKPVPQPIKAGEKLSYQIIFTNTGKTPALDTQVLSRIQFDPNDSFIITYFKNDIPDDPNVGKAPLAPNAGIIASHTYEKVVNEKLFLRIESGETDMFVLVKIEYRDIFGEPHETHACLRYCPEKKGLIAYHKYNYMD